MTEPTYADSFFTCRQIPLRLDTSQYERIKKHYSCPDCKVRFTTLLAGNGVLLPTPSGLTFDSPQASLEVNGIRHSIIECMITTPAVHKIDVPGVGLKDISGGELHIRFRGEQSANIGSYYTMIIPLKIGSTGASVEFFRSLDVIQRDRLKLSDILLPTTPLLLYKGVDLAKKGVGCNNESTQKVNYLYYTVPLNIERVDLNRFRRKLQELALAPSAASAYVGLRNESQTISESKESIISYIPTFTITSIESKLKKNVNGYVEKAQVKCRPLDMTRDIKGTKVYVGGPGTSRTLEEELKDASDVYNNLESSGGGLSVSTIETILAWVIGIVLGITLMATVAYYVHLKGGWGYLKNKMLYSKPMVPKGTNPSPP